MMEDYDTEYDKVRQNFSNSPDYEYDLNVTEDELEFQRDLQSLMAIGNLLFNLYLLYYNQIIFSKKHHLALVKICFSSLLSSGPVFFDHHYWEHWKYTCRFGGSSQQNNEK